MDINQFAQEVHKTAVEHGWWDNPPSFGEIVALCHSELSEALEECRSQKPLAYVNRAEGVETDFDRWAPSDKPEGVAVEMADCIIRILDWAAANGVDMEELLQKKAYYNRRRPYRHGGKAL